MSRPMEWYMWMAVAACVLCALLLLGKFWGLLRLGAPRDLSEPAGSVKKGVIYSSTIAMLPQNKESAYLHLPTYTAGVIYHIGIFLSLLGFVWFVVAGFLGWSLPLIFNQLIALVLLVTTACGVFILLKRIFSSDLRSLSTFDDYLSNLLVTLMQALTALMFWGVNMPLFYYVVMTLVFLWIPLGKTRHVLYFFFARYHLGYFYGRRGSWPVPKM